jgi:ketosteroid isomerase-like protein
MKFCARAEEFIETYEKALTNQSWEHVAPLIHEHCVTTFTEGTYIGKAEVESAFRKTFALIKDEKFVISNIHWVQETEHTAIFIYTYSWSGIIEGRFVTGSGRGTSVLTKHNGTWKLICEHLGPHARAPSSSHARACNGL